MENYYCYLPQYILYIFSKDAQTMDLYTMLEGELFYFSPISCFQIKWCLNEMFNQAHSNLIQRCSRIEDPSSQCGIASYPLNIWNIVIVWCDMIASPCLTLSRGKRFVAVQTNFTQNAQSKEMFLSSPGIKEQFLTHCSKQFEIIIKRH